jgi:hypothetical protein
MRLPGPFCYKSPGHKKRKKRFKKPRVRAMAKARTNDHRLLGATPPPAPPACGLRPRFALPTRHPPGAAPLALRAHLLNSSACGAVHDEEDQTSLSPQAASFKVTESTQRHHSVRRAENKADRFTPRGGSTRSRRYARRNLLDREPMFS